MGKWPNYCFLKSSCPIQCFLFSSIDKENVCRHVLEQNKNYCIVWDINNFLPVSSCFLLPCWPSATQKCVIHQNTQLFQPRNLLCNTSVASHFSMYRKLNSQGWSNIIFCYTLSLLFPFSYQCKTYNEVLKTNSGVLQIPRVRGKKSCFRGSIILTENTTMIVIFEIVLHQLT